MNTLFYQLFSEAQQKPKKDILKNALLIFFNLSKINDSDFNYYIPQNISQKFEAMVEKEKDNVEFENNMMVLTREQLNY